MGPVYLNSNSVVNAIAVEYGKQISEVSSKSIILSVPERPVISLFNTKDKIAAGKVATVKWQEVENATAYDAVLYLNGSPVDSAENIHGTIASFTLSDVGVYSIQISAKNFIGSSAPSNSISVESMAPVTVTVIDHIIREGPLLYASQILC
jgi:hypothetical protein